MVQTIRKNRPWWILILVGVMCAFVIGIAMLEVGHSEMGWRFANRYLVRVGFPLFFLSFVASSLLVFWQNPFTRYLRKNRRYLGLAFAVAHFTHLGAIVLLYGFLEEEVGLITLVGGGSTYVLLALMVLTSNDYAFNKLGKNWHRLHKLGTYALWIVFAQSYLGRVHSGPEGIWFVIPTTLLFLGLLLRSLAFFTKRSN